MHREPPDANRLRRSKRALLHSESTAIARVTRAFVAIVGRTRGAHDVRARAIAKVSRAGLNQAIERTFVSNDPVALPVGPERATDVGTFVEDDPEPREIADDRRFRPGFHPRHVDVVDPQDDLTTRHVALLRREELDRRTADVELARGRRREASTVASGRTRRGVHDVEPARSQRRTSF